MSSYTLIVVSLGYLGALFAIAYWAERRSRRGKSTADNPYIYSLSLAVYCTAWTFYGSVGRASAGGLAFLPTFIGPAITIPLWWVVLRKIIRISKVQRITSLADFISARYGKSTTIGMMVTLICVLSLLPYISLQLKAISNSFAILSEHRIYASLPQNDIALYITVVLSLFTILFGTRKVEATEHHEGLVTVIAFESVVKLTAFLAVGLFVTYGVFGGFSDIFNRALDTPALSRQLTIDPEGGYTDWFWQNILAALTILFLPRLFQIAVVENVNEDHLRKAIWVFPLYLLLINLFVLPIAFSGSLLFGGHVDADNYVLAIPLHFEKGTLAVLTYLGGFSAATGMIIVETTALSVMISNNLVMPLLLKVPVWKERTLDSTGSFLINIRRSAIVLLLLLAYLYYKNIAGNNSLVSTGLISFVGIAQFAPMMIGGLFWKQGNRAGAMAGLIAGTLTWFYTLVIPSVVTAGLLPDRILMSGPLGIQWLHPYSLLGMKGLQPEAHSLFWSLMVNVFLYVWGAFRFKKSVIEHSQATLFTEVFYYSEKSRNAAIWRGKALITDIQSLLRAFLGKSRTERLLQNYAAKHQLNSRSHYADPEIVAYAEQLLAGAVGAASARLMVASVSKEEKISIEEVVGILKQSQELMAVNRELKKTSEKLRLATADLSRANELLRMADKKKDEFITTVTHEIRTPLTSIRALSEIIHDHPGMDPGERQHFLDTIIRESERLSRLINQVLDLEKIEAGLNVSEFRLCSAERIIDEAIDSVRQLAVDKKIRLEVNNKVKLPDFPGDHDRLVQALINLVSNSLKFCEPGTGEVQVEAFQRDGFVLLSVRDNGIGIEDNFKDRIFDKFYQISRQDLGKPPGSGVGLAITRKIIELHRGEIPVESRPDMGTVFTVKLPVDYQE